MINNYLSQLKVCKDAYSFFISRLNTKESKNKISIFLKETYLIQTAKSLIEIAWKELGRDQKKIIS